MKKCCRDCKHCFRGYDTKGKYGIKGYFVDRYCLIRKMIKYGITKCKYWEEK